MKNIEYSYERKRLFSGYDKKMCKVCPQIATDGNLMFITYRMLLLSGSDVYYDTYISKSTDNGKTFSEPVKMNNFQKNENGKRSISHGWLTYSKYNDIWFAIGEENEYTNDKHQKLVNDVIITKPKQFSFSTKNCDFTETKSLPFPFECDSVTPCPQLVEFENGDLLIPFYFLPKGKKTASVVTVKYEFKDGFLIVKNAGKPISVDNYRRGIYEPALVKCADKYYLALRSDEKGLFSVSSDGYEFSEPTPYTWEDGEEIGNYNTMQHWICHDDCLFLAYTRKGAHNDHVFRHRAPIFMARFDTERNCLIRNSEIILVPELGTRLGNFNVVDTQKNVTSLITAEWMQPIGCEKYGSDNSLWIANINWK